MPIDLSSFCIIDLNNSELLQSHNIFMCMRPQCVFFHPYTYQWMLFQRPHVTILLLLYFERELKWMAQLTYGNSCPTPSVLVEVLSLSQDINALAVSDD